LYVAILRRGKEEIMGGRGKEGRQKEIREE